MSDDRRRPTTPYAASWTCLLDSIKDPIVIFPSEARDTTHLACFSLLGDPCQVAPQSFASVTSCAASFCRHCCQKRSDLRRIPIDEIGIVGHFRLPILRSVECRGRIFPLKNWLRSSSSGNDPNWLMNMLDLVLAHACIGPEILKQVRLYLQRPFEPP
jgi:hypothetical protein